MKTDGNMIDEDLLHDLAAADGPTTIRPLSEITYRAGILRRQRRLTMAGTASAMAGVAVAVTVTVTVASLNLIGPDPGAQRIVQPSKHTSATRSRTAPPDSPRS